MAYDDPEMVDRAQRLQARPYTDALDAEGANRLRAHVIELEALLRRADSVVIWEVVMPDGRAFQERVEKALGVVAPAKYSAKER